MINIKKLTENLNRMYPNRETLTEDTFSDLARTVDTGRKLRASSLPAYYRGLDQAPDGHARTHWEVPSQSDRGTKYQQVIQIHVPLEGGLFTVAKGPWKLKTFSEAFANADVRVHCTCPDFYWSGMKYNLGPGGPHKGSLAPEQSSGVSREQYPIKPPDIRDPERKHTICKHLYSVFTVFRNNATSIMKDAKGFDVDNEFIEINDEITRNSDDGRATLEKNIDTVGVTEGDASIVTDSLLQAAEILDREKDSGTEELIDTQNAEVVDTSEEETKDQGVEEIIDTENEEVTEEIAEEIEVAKDQGAEDIIEDENIEATAEETEEPAPDEVMEKKTPDLKEKVETEEKSARDILDR